MPSSFLLSILLVLLFSSSYVTSTSAFIPSPTPPNKTPLNPLPIIGVFAHPKTSASLCPVDTSGKSCQYIASSYVKFVESAGGRVVPIPYYASNETIAELFTQINGVIFPGGNADLPPSAIHLYDLAVRANDAGDYFPIWGTCLGFEWMMQLSGGTLDVGFNSENVSLPLYYTKYAGRSELFDGLDDDLYRLLASTESPAFNNHHAGILTSNFKSNKQLVSTYKILSTSYDMNDLDFISTVEAFHYPFYAVQWHPEKNAYELGINPNGSPYEDIIHTADAIDIAYYLAKFFISLARRSSHRFEDPSVMQRSLIWNYKVLYTEALYSGSDKPCGFAQEYIDDFSFPGPVVKRAKMEERRERDELDGIE